MSTHIEVPIASSVDELLAYNGEQFIQCAYLTILNRSVDPVGLEYYLNRLQSGYSKVSIIKQLSSSYEAKTQRVSIVGLKSAVRNYKLAQYPMARWVLHIPTLSPFNAPIKRLKLTKVPVLGSLLEAKYTDNDGTSARKVRHLEYRLHQIETSLTDESGTLLNESELAAIEVAEALEKLPIYAQEIYVELKDKLFSSGWVS